VSAASGRLKWPARQLVTPGYAALDLAMAVAADDAERLEYLGCTRDRIAVTGDPRVDSVLQVAAATPTDDLALPAFDPAVTLVAGSTWPEDEAIVLGALARVRQRHPGARLIIAPHQPTATHLHGVDAAARRLGLPDPVRFSALGRGAIPAVIAVDRTGVLARLYGSGALAYVGGGWGRKGIHSVLEPAAWGRPIVIGPIDRDNRDVQMLEQRGALLRLSEPDGVTQLAEAWGAWLDHPADALVAGAAGRAALEEARGAATRSAGMLKQLLERR
jgi:3-deoxy-D-manno-octulosonic-acid transferase